MAAGVLSWDIVARDKASAALLRVAESSDKTAAGTTRAAESMARLDASMAGLSVASDKQRAAALRQVAAQERVDSVMASSRVSVERLAMAEANLISAQRGVVAAQEESAAATRRFGGAVGGSLKMVRDLGLMFGAFELVKKGIDITKEANSFQRSMVQVQTNADVTATEVHKASGALLAMAGPVAAAPDELATAWYHAKSVGLDYAKSIKVTRIAAEGARVGNADLEETMNALTSTVASGIPGVKDMSSAMGQLITIVGSGDMKLSDLNEALGTGVLVRMKQYGLSLTDVGAALATFGDNNIRGADAATLLRMSVEAMAKQGHPGQEALAGIGIKANQLRDDLQKGGLNKAVLDLNSHLHAAGITGNRVGGFLIDAFTKKGGGGVAVLLGQIDRLEQKFHVLRSSGASFGDKWAATQETASFALAKLGHTAEAAGIALTAKLGPSIAQVAQWFGTELPVAAHAATAILGGPLSVAWCTLGAAVEVAGAVLKPVLGLLNSPVGHGVAVGVLAMWAAFKGFEIAVAAGRAIQGAMFAMQLRAETGIAAFRTWGTNVRGAFNGMGADAAATTAVMQADFAKIEQSAMQEAAAVDRAAAQQAEAYAVLVAASDDATASMIANSQNAAMAAQAQAAATEAALLEVSAAADAAAADVDAAGEAAAVGWSAVLGPIGLVVIGVTAAAAAFGLFGRSTRDNTADVEALTAAIKEDSGALGDNTRTAVAHALAQSGALKNARTLGLSVSDVTSAVLQGGPALDALTKSLSLYSVGSYGATKDSSARARAARELINALGGENSSVKTAADNYRLESAAAKDSAGATGANAATTANASLAFDKLAAKLDLSTDSVKQYAGMLGLAVTANGELADASARNQRAIVDMADVYDTASSSITTFLGAIQTFSSSAGSSADRAALIGSTLQAANGDALAYAGAMNGAATATTGLVSSLQSAAQQVGKNGESVHDLMGQIVNLTTGTINYKNSAAAPLISGLQGIQSAAMAAASATFQHNRATEGGKKAADDAYQVYKSQTRGALMDEATQLGLTSGQAKKLADKYFGMPKKVKTLIEQEGANPVVDVLNKIGEQLAILTGHPWKPKVDINDKATPKAQSIHDAINSITDKTVTVTVNTAGNLGSTYNSQVPQFHAAGGSVWGPGTGTSDSIPARLSTGEFVVRASQASKHRGLLESINKGARGFAAGGIVHSGKDWIYNGHRYASERAAENAETTAASKAASQADSARSAARSAINAFRGVAMSAQSSASDLLSAGKDFLAAGKAAGLSKVQLQSLAATQRTINADARQRDRIDARLGSAPTPPTAYERLATAQQNYSGAKQTVRSAFTGSFDITQAGGNSFGEPVTFSAMKRQLDKAVANAKRFAQALRRLGHEGLNKGLIQQLADAGPSALPQALALLSATPKQLRAFNAEYGQLGKAGGAAGTQVADEMYGAGVKSAQGLVNGLLSQRRALNRAIRSLAHGMVSAMRSELDMHSPSRRLFNEGAMAFEGFRQGIESKHAAIESAARGAAEKSVDGASGGVGASNGVGGPAIGELHLHYSHPDDYHRATATAMRAATTVLK